MIRRLAQRWADAQLRRHNELLHDRWIRGQQRNRFLTEERTRLMEERNTLRALLRVQRSTSADRLAELDRLRLELKQLREEQ
ncbi:MAG: hypothetical protein HOV94_34560 [Saccharothrix sp.]|nr:hypothetical protein [Saccharothrix sp.]